MSRTGLDCRVYDMSAPSILLQEVAEYRLYGPAPSFPKLFDATSFFQMLLRRGSGLSCRSLDPILNPVCLLWCRTGGTRRPLRGTGGRGTCRSTGGWCATSTSPAYGGASRKATPWWSSSPSRQSSMRWGKTEMGLCNFAVTGLL